MLWDFADNQGSHRVVTVPRQWLRQAATYEQDRSQSDMNTENQNGVPTSISIAMALVTFFLLRAGFSELAWVVIIIGGLALGILIGSKKGR